MTWPWVNNFTVRPVQGAIGNAVHDVVPRLPYAISVDSSTGVILVRLFGSVTDEQHEAITSAIGNVAPVHVYAEVTREPTALDLEALAVGALRGQDGAADVLVDALLELGVLDGERSRLASDDVAEGRAYLGRLALLWAGEVFGPYVETDEDLRNRLIAYRCAWPREMRMPELAHPLEIDTATAEHLDSLAAMHGLRRHGNA